MKFCRPVYRALFGLDKTLAVETFQKNERFYHPVSPQTASFFVAAHANQSFGDVTFFFSSFFPDCSQHDSQGSQARVEGSAWMQTKERDV